MTLLVEMMQRPLDPGYAAAAERRRAQGRGEAPGIRHPSVFVTAVILGFALAVAAATLRPDGSVVNTGRERLVAQVESRQQAGDAKVQEIAALRSEVDALTSAALDDAGAGQLQQDVARLELSTGVVAVAGPGVILDLDDAPALDEDEDRERPGSEFTAGRVTARDIQVMTNGLWAAGAEAVAVNGQRLTSRSAIRFAGQAILVDYRPLTRPYRISAIGDPTALTNNFANSLAGVYLKALEDRYRITSEFIPTDKVTLPASVGVQIDLARPQEDGP